MNEILLATFMMFVLTIPLIGGVSFFQLGWSERHDHDRNNQIFSCMFMMFGAALVGISITFLLITYSIIFNAAALPQ